MAEGAERVAGVDAPLGAADGFFDEASMVVLVVEEVGFETEKLGKISSDEG